MNVKGIRAMGLSLCSIGVLTLNTGCDLLGFGEQDDGADTDTGDDDDDDDNDDDDDDDDDDDIEGSSSGGGPGESEGGFGSSGESGSSGENDTANTVTASTTGIADDSGSDGSFGEGAYESGELSTSGVFPGESSETAEISTSGDVDDDESSGTGPDEPPPVLVDYENDIQPIWNTSCALSSCHGGVFMPNLSEGSSYAALVNEISSTGKAFVVPGSADESYLWLKLVNAPGISGSAMPFGAPQLSEEALSLISAWIEQLPTP